MHRAGDHLSGKARENFSIARAAPFMTTRAPVMVMRDEA